MNHPTVKPVLTTVSVRLERTVFVWFLYFYEYIEQQLEHFSIWIAEMNKIYSGVYAYIKSQQRLSMRTLVITYLNKKKLYLKVNYFENYT